MTLGDESQRLKDQVAVDRIRVCLIELTKSSNVAPSQVLLTKISHVGGELNKMVDEYNRQNHGYCNPITPLEVKLDS